MFATDVASRGLDIPDVTCVYQFEPASEAADHVHRIGRTGRAGKKGRAVVYVMEGWEESKLRDIVYSMRKSGQVIDPELEQRAQRAGGRY